MTNSKPMIHARRQRRRRKTSGTAILFRLFIAFGVVLVGTVAATVVTAAAAVGGIYATYARDLPDASALAQTQEDESFETVKIYDRTGQHLLYEVLDPRPFRGDRTYMRLSELPQVLLVATVALEDRDFYQNPGINPRGLLRALVSTVTGSQVQGGSSITQQLIKNTLIAPEERYIQSIPRKIREVILALEITRRFEKDQILEWYLNSNFYGNFAYGPEAAARVYFDKPARELTLAEAAMLAAIPQYPAMNPIDNPDQAKERQRRALFAMVDAGVITAAQAEQAFAEPLAIRQRVQERFSYLDAPHFALYVLDELSQRYNTPDQPFFLWQRGLRVYTTLNLDLQREAEAAAREQVAALTAQAQRAQDAPPMTAAVVAIRPQTGEIMAMVGSLDYNDTANKGQLNMAIAPRQPGSSFKPYTYLTAFEQGYSPATMALDVRTVFPDPPNPPYVPENFDRRYHGAMSLRSALANSFNIPAVWLMEQVGIKEVIATAHRLGINGLREDYYGLSLTLGGGEVTLLDHVYAFSALANGGTLAGTPTPVERQTSGYRTLDPVSILQVVDKDGNTIYQYDHPEVERVADERHVYLLTDILSDNNARAPMFGLNNPLTLPDRPVAAKTGTTNDTRDVWTLGFTPQLAVGVWMGNVDYESIGRLTGANGAAPIWQRVMTYAHRDQPVIPFTEPPGISHVVVCVPSGLLPTPDCPSRRTELFVAGTEPQAYDTIYQAFEVNRETGKLATEYTPRELVERRVYEIYPPEAADWIRDRGIAQPPQVYDDAYGGAVDPEVGISSPNPYSFVRGQLAIMGNARPGNFRAYRVEFGPGLNPTQWTQIGPEHFEAVGGGPLEYWDTGPFNGLYTVRLTVDQHDGSRRQAHIQVTVDNAAPTVSIIHPLNDAIYTMEDDEWVSITVDATDNWSMDRVEFIMDGNVVGSYTVAPYNHRWNIVMGGGVTETHTIQARAFDAAGNVAESAPVTVEVTRRRPETTGSATVRREDEPLTLAPALQPQPGT